MSAPGNVLESRMLDGDDLAFAELADRHGLRLRLFIRGLAPRALGGDLDEEDLVQLVIFRAWQLKESFVPQGPGSFHGWLIALARNVVGDRIRYLGGKGRKKGREAVNAASLASAIPESITSVASRAARGEEADRLGRRMAELSPEQRELVQLYYVEGLSLAQVAERCGRARSSVWDELKTALGALRGGLAD